MNPQANVRKDDDGRVSAGAKCPNSACLLHRRRSRPLSFVGLVLFFAMGSAPVFAQDAAAKEMTWPEATAQLANLRTTAETCVSLLKRYGNAAKKAQGRLDYADAKGNVDAIIAGLTTALATDDSPSSLLSLQDRLTKSSSSLKNFCGAASSVLPSSTGHKGLIDEIAKSAIEPLVKAVSDGVAALYNNHRADSALTRRTIQTQLEAAKWLDFDKIPSAQ